MAHSNKPQERCCHEGTIRTGDMKPIRKYEVGQTLPLADLYSAYPLHLRFPGGRGVSISDQPRGIVYIFIDTDNSCTPLCVEGPGYICLLDHYATEVITFCYP